jgi:hypothetical protein
LTNARKLTRLDFVGACTSHERPRLVLNLSSRSHLFPDFGKSLTTAREFLSF